MNQNEIEKQIIALQIIWDFDFNLLLQDIGSGGSRGSRIKLLELEFRFYLNPLFFLLQFSEFVRLCAFQCFAKKNAP